MNLILITPPNDPSDSKYNDSNIEPSKNALYTIPIIQKEINEYFDDLSNNFPSVYKSVQKLYNTMKQGKKFGEFLKTPVLFVHTIDQIIYYNGSQDFIDKTKDIYSKICDYFDKLIYSIIPKSFLKANNGTYFTTKDLFKVDNNNLDLNYDIETLIGEILYEYPHFYECIQFICNTEMYLSKLNTLENIEFSTDFYKSTFNLDLEPIFFDEYKLIWDTLNSKDLITLYENAEKINPEMKEIIPYYYINNFLNQQCSNKVSKIAISYWLNPEKAKQEFADELGEKEIEVLEEISKPSSNNAWFKLSTIIYSDVQNYYRENFAFLKKLYESEQTVDPILFSRLILYMIFHNNRNNFETIFANKDIESIKQEINSFVKLNILSNYNNLEKYPQILFSRNNSILDKVVSKYGIESIKFPDLSNQPTFFKKKPPLTPLEKDVRRLKFGNYFRRMSTSIKCGLGTFTKFFKPKENKLWTTLAFVTNAVSLLFSSTALICPFMGGVAAILEFLASVIYKSEYFSYIFETNDVKYIWNGGFEESWLLGLKKGECSTIDDMKLLEPMQVVKPNNLQGYYYDGKTYGDFSKLKYTQLNDILNDRYSNDKLKKVYSLIDLENEVEPNIEFYSESIDDLLISISNHIRELISNDVFDDDQIVKKSTYKFDSFVYDELDTLQNNTNKILGSIKPMLIAQIPKLNPKGHKLSNKPICNDSNNFDDCSLKPYKLPGLSWTSNGGYFENDDTNFIMVDQNISDDKNSSKSKGNEIINYKKQLEDKFYASFEVDSKEIEYQFINNIDLFSEISSKIESNFCYFAKGKNNQRKIFLSKNDAINWLLTEFNYKTHFVLEEIETVVFDDLKFSSYDEYMNWVYENIREVK
ncbi:MAG: hypothetical protein K2K73_00675 [Ureaplasma sp.]|nr:hypothetical protein [Ureaplasma sp.]